MARDFFARSVAVATFMPGGGLADAGGGQVALALDLHHAGAAIAVGPIAGLRRIAEMGDLLAEPGGDLPDGLAVLSLDLLAVKGEADRHDRSSCRE